MGSCFGKKKTSDEVTYNFIPKPPSSAPPKEAKDAPDIAGQSNTNTVEMPVSDSLIDWMKCYDAEGDVYYFNSITGESRWDPPTQIA